VTVRPWTLPAAAWLAAAEAATIIAALAIAGVIGAPLYIAFLLVKFPFCWFAAQRSPAAYLVLYVWEVAGAIAAFGAGGRPVGLRLLEVGVAGIVVALLVVSTPLFPAVQLPSSSES
jgi:hypothetical protein